MCWESVLGRRRQREMEAGWARMCPNGDTDLEKTRANLRTQPGLPAAAGAPAGILAPLRR